MAVQGLAGLAEAGGDVDGAAEVDDLALAVADLANHHLAAVHADAIPRCDAEVLFEPVRAARGEFIDGHHAANAAGILHGIGELPRYHDLVTDISMGLAAEAGDGGGDIREEAGDVGLPH